MGWNYSVKFNVTDGLKCITGIVCDRTSGNNSSSAYPAYLVGSTMGKIVEVCAVWDTAFKQCPKKSDGTLANVASCT